MSKKKKFNLKLNLNLDDKTHLAFRQMINSCSSDRVQEPKKESGKYWIKEIEDLYGKDI